MNDTEEPAKLSQPNEPAWELALGIKWFSRMGIVALLIGFAMALNYSFPYLNSILLPQVKLLIGAFMAFGLFLTGGKLFSRFQLLGRILQGGGLSLGYLTLFGMFFIPAVQIFSEPGLQSLGWGLLFLYVTAMIVCARNMGSVSVAVLSLAFGYYTASFSGSQLIAFLATTLLSGASVILGSMPETQRQKWQIIPKISFFGFIFTYLFWHMSWSHGNNYITTMPGVLFDISLDQLLYLVIQFLIFHIANLLSNNSNRPLDSDLIFSGLNTLSVYSLMVLTQPWFTLDYKGLAEFEFLSIQLVSLLYCLRKGTQKTLESQIHLVLASMFALLGIMAALNAEMTPIALAAEAMILGFISARSSNGRVYQGLSVVILAATFYSLTQFDWQAISAIVLLTSVGIVAAVGLILENTAYRTADTILRISLMIVCSVIFLIAIMIGLENYWITLAIVLSGFTLLMNGFLSHQAKYRWMGLAWIFLAGFRLITIDLLTLAPPYKILLFLVLGVTLLVGSYGYNLLNRKLAIKESDPLNLPE
jgi:hypothetical protein